MAPRRRGPARVAGPYVAPHWPRPWGLGRHPGEQLAIDVELRAAACPAPLNPIGIGWAGPTLLVAGTTEQHQRYLPGSSTGPRSGASSSASRARGATSRRSRPAASATATSTSCTARRSGRRSRTSPATGSCSREPIPTPSRTAASRTSSSTCARRASRRARSARWTVTPTSTRCSSTTCASRPPTSSVTSTTAGASRR